MRGGRTAASAAFVLSILLATAGCGGGRSVEVDLAGPPAPPSDAGPALRFAVAPVLSPERAVETYQALADHLAARLGRPVRLVQRKTYAEVNELLRAGSVQWALLCTGTYVRAEADGVALEVLAVPATEEGPVYRSLLVVEAASPIRSIEDLRGKRIAFSDPLSLSGHFYPTHVVREAGEDPRTYFSRTVFTYSHDGSLRAVLDGIADAAATNDLVFDHVAGENPEFGRRFRVIHRSPPLPGNPVVAPAAADPALKAAVREALLGMDRTEEGRRVLSGLGIVRFEAPAPGFYAPAKRIVERAAPRGAP